MKVLIVGKLLTEIALLIAVTPSKAQTFINGEIDAQNSREAMELLQQGKQQLQREDYHSAINNFNQAILLNPESADTYFQRGLIRFKLEDRLGAISDFDDAILYNPHHSWAYFHRAGVFFNLGNQSEAIVDLQQAAKLFAEQGEDEGHQKAQQLLRHFGVVNN